MAQITKQQFLRGTAAQFTTADPTLLAGQVGFETDTGKAKIGDGSTAWTSLGYNIDPVEQTALRTLSGTSAGATDLGTFTGTTITDNTDIKTALQELESAVGTAAAGMEYQGVWDASAGTFPGGGSAAKGDVYKVSVAGTVDSVTFQVGDTLVAEIDNASATTFTGNWNKWDTIDQVTSVHGRVGAVVAVSGDYIASEITNSPSGSISATTVQGAIDELASESLADPMTTRGDIIRAGVGGAPERYALGAVGTVYQSDGTDIVASDTIDGGTIA